jgi:hypothetical protein
MVRDILDVFQEVLPCFHMTVLSSSWVRWFSKPLLSPRICAGYPGLVGWAWTTTWRVERQKLYLALFLSKGLSSFVCVEARWYLLFGYVIFSLLIWVWAIDKSNSAHGPSRWCFYSWFSLECNHHLLLVWPILLPCSCNIWVHLLGASK